MSTTTRFRNLVRKMVLPLAVCGMMCATEAAAQADIIGFYSTSKDSTFTAPGGTVEFTIRFYGTIVVSNLAMTGYVQPEIRLEVGSDGSSSSAYAKLVRSQWTGTAFDPFNRTDLTFAYTIRPGDMADPMKIFGSPLLGFQIFKNQCEFFRGYAPGVWSNNVTWKVNTLLYDEPGANGLDSTNPYGTIVFGDVDMSFQNIVLRTLSYDPANSPNTLVARAPARSWRIQSGGTNSIPVKVWVWTPHTNVLQIGTSPGLPLEVTIPAGSDYVDFPIKGLATNAIPTIATVYAQRPSDYARNSTVVTNYITRNVTITPAGAPTISLEFSNGMESQTLSETNDVDTGSFQIVLSEATTNRVYVDFTIAHQPSTLTNIIITPQPGGYYVEAGQERSDPYYFSVVNGTRESARAPFVRITPTATNTAIYTIARAGILNIPNVAPSVLWYPPATGDENTPVVFDWSDLIDVDADINRGITFRWNFGDSAPVVQTNFTTFGQITHTYTGIGDVPRSYTVTLTITDADGGSYTLPSHTITITPAPKPANVSVAVNRADLIYQEGDTTARYRVILSAPALQSTMIQLVATYVVDGTSADNCLGLTVTNNIVIPTGLTSSVPYTMTIKDGTVNTTSGILITPTITNAAALLQYPGAYAGIVIIENVAPDIDTVPTCKPTTSALAPYNAIELGKPFTFRYAATDITADLNGTPPITVEFQFQDGTSVTNTSANGTVTHTFNVLGGQSVTMIATDKDGGLRTVTFPITIVPPLPPPSITVFDYPVFIAENDSTSAKQLTIQLSQAPITTGLTNPVVVFLDVTPVNSAVNGAITIPASVTFYSSQTTKTVNFTVQDGTVASATSGFLVTPRIAVGAPGDSVYVQREPGNILVQNVAPLIIQPIDGSTNTIATVGQARTFTWSVRDVVADLPTMQLVWDWGDGTTSTTTGGSGSIAHTYMSASAQLSVSVTATDKDGDYHIISFYVTVKDSKKIIALPIGPNTAGFNGLTDLGTGTIVATNASPTVWDPVDLFYTFYFGASEMSAQLIAIPTPTPLPLSGKQSYFFAWNGPLAAFQDQTHVTMPLAPRSTIINLPSGTIGTGGATAGTTLNGNIVQVSAIFTVEYSPNDVEVPAGVNNGDLNQDGVPDRLVQRYFVDPTAGAGGGTGNQTTLNQVWFQNLSGFNEDEDYLPVYPTGDNTGVLDFRPVANPYTINSVAVNAFTAFMEIRGYDGFLGTADDPRTDPTINDTDADGYPDGWEYWFWYESNINGRVGSRYNPFNVAQGDLIGWSEIVAAFDPMSPRSAYSEPLWRDDFDNDGLLDIEEMVVGSDPTNWDTDGDIMADGWEILNGFLPGDRRDGNLPMQNNPDGDYFAISTALRRHFQVVTTNGGVNAFGDPVLTVVTNHFFMSIDTNTFQVIPNTLATAYRYGDELTGPWAVGRPVPDNSLTPANRIASPAPEDITPLIMHFQVRNEYLFDPRTAWSGNAGGGGAPAGWPYDNADRFGPYGSSPNTCPFTAVDEYLLLKFMYELRLNGMVATNNSGWIARFERAINLYASNNNAIVFNNTRRLLIQESWSRFTTHPHTPDTDGTAVPAPEGSDGIPDGWELYIAVAPGVRGNVNTFVHSPWAAPDGISWEFWGFDSLLQYASPNLYYFGMTNNNPLIGVVTIIRPVDDPDNYWTNKRWPTDPFNADTDSDGLADGAERAFMYGNAVAPGAGGGLNPCSVDTDRDALPDVWEVQFAGAPVAADGSTSLPPLLPGQPEPYVAMTINDGQDGTVADAFKDADLDGLVSYQEYMTQALRCYRYDIPLGAVVNDVSVVDPVTRKIGQPMDITFEIGALFEPVTNEWDQAMHGWAPPLPPEDILWWMRPAGNLYCSTDPNNPDSDYDSMDDYYEMYHGLNPLLGNGLRLDLLDDRVAYAYGAPPYPGIGMPPFAYNNNWYFPVYFGFTMDFVPYPWLNGMPVADPDADGLLNLEEMLIVNMPLPENYNTDPSPLWATDLSNINSLTARFYAPFGYTGYKTMSFPLYRAMFFWPTIPYPMCTYSFEMNEGYDTDNDGVSDKDEMVANRNTKSNPLDSDDQLRRQALWFAGNRSAATSPFLYTDGSTIIGQQFIGMNDAFRSFTVELWARPEWVTTAAGQVLIERTFDYGQSDASNSGPRMRRNFIIGISPEGRLYGGFDNPGGHDEHTDSARLYGPIVQSNKWVHVVVRMDGRTSELSLLVNGQQQGRMPTALIPATGIDPVVPTDPGTPPVIRNGSLTLGAENLTFSQLGYGFGSLANFPPMLPYMAWDSSWAAYDKFYRGWIDEVRVWDGARSDAEIAADYKKRLTRAYLDENRSRLVAELSAGRGRTALHFQAGLYLSPILLNYYTFDNLFSTVDPQYVATVPRGFNSPAVNVNRPDGNGDTFGDAVGAVVGWWNNFALRNTVYTNYHYLPWIENLAAHLPQMSSIINTSGVFEVTYGLVIDSRYWTAFRAGNVAQTNSFPNSNNPYTFTYGSQIPVDLIPMGETWAKQCTDFWDNLGASGPWLENRDTIDDGLPSSWIRLNYGAYTPLTTDYTDFWNKTYAGANALYVALRLTNGQAYQYDLSKGWLPSATAYNDYNSAYTSISDMDSDGLPDLWEKIFGLDMLDPIGSNGPEGDPDGDLLPNIYEYWCGTDPNRYSTFQDGISDYDRDADVDRLSNGEEVIYQTNPADKDTDDDGLQDFTEVDDPTDILNPTSPFIQRSLVNDGTGYVQVPKNPIVRGVNADLEGSRFDLPEWTISTLVKLTAIPTNNIILMSRSVNRANQILLNYEVGIAANTMIPYVRFNTATGLEYRMNSYKALETNVWTQVGGRFGSFNRDNYRQLSVLQDYVAVTRDVTGIYCVTGEQSGDMLIGRNLIGEMDEVSLWKEARTDEQVEALRGKTLLFGKQAARAKSLQGGIRVNDPAHQDDPALVYGHSTIQSNDNLADTDPARQGGLAELWFKTPTAAAPVRQSLVNKPTGIMVAANAPAVNYEIYVDVDGRVKAQYFGYYYINYFPYGIEFGYFNVILTSNQRVDDDLWHHVALDITKQRTTLYVDGEVVDSKRFRPAVDADINAWYPMFMQDPNNSAILRALWLAGFGTCSLAVGVDDFYVGDVANQGLIDEVRIFGQPQDSSLIIQRRAKKIAPTTTGLNVYYDFDDVVFTVERPGVPDMVNEEQYGRILLGSELVEPNAPLAASSLDMMLAKLALYMPFDDGRYVSTPGLADPRRTSAVADMIYYANGWSYNRPYAGTLVNGIEFTVLTNRYKGTFPAVPIDVPIQLDSDQDGMSDEYEVYYSLDPNRKQVPEDVERMEPESDPDEDGLSNLYEYLSGTDPWRPCTANNRTLDPERDLDGDGLVNLDEMLFNTHPQLKDTDDDDFEDGTEVMYGWNPTSSASPGKQRVLALDGAVTSYVSVPDFNFGAYANRLAVEDFTLSADIYPLITPATSADLISRNIGPGLYNYLLRLHNNMTVSVAFTAKDYSAPVTLTTTAAVPLNKWTSVQVVLDALNETLKIYFNGVEVAALSKTLVSRAADRFIYPSTVIGRGFAGYMDNVSISDTVGTRLHYTFDDGTSFSSTTPTSSYKSIVSKYGQVGQVEDFAAVISSLAPDWTAPNWYNRFSAAGTLTGNVAMVYFSPEGITEDQLDSDEDGLSDAWEIANGFDPYSPDSNGNTIADGDEDTDGDGLTNYYEYLAGLNPRKASSDNVRLDIERDNDGDGLMNQLEQANGTMPNNADTDDDGIGDYEEIYGTNVARNQAVGISDPLNSLSPFIPRGLVLNGSGAVIVTNQARHELIEWTIGAWVNPSTLFNGTVLARSFNNGRVNYELGVEADGTTLRPFARYTAVGVNGVTYDIKVGHPTLAPGSIPVHGSTNQVISLLQNKWTHLAMVYAPGEHTFYLYVNGDCVAYRTDAIPLPVTTDLRFADRPQLLIGARRLTGVATYENAFRGMIDDVRIASYAVDYRGVRNMMGEQLVVDTRGVVETNATAQATQVASTMSRPAPEAVPNEFLVGIKDGISSSNVIKKFKTDYNVDTIRTLKLANALYVRIPAGVDVLTAKQKMKADADVKYVEPNYIVHATQQKIPNDPRFTELWGMDNTGQLNGTADADIDAPEAWAVSTGSPSVLVAVIDTGVDYNHPDLAANMWVNPDEIPDNKIDDDGNGIVDDVHGINATDTPVTGDPMDDVDHGTHCAGTIGAVGDNSEGVAGVNWTVKIMALKFLGPFGGSTAGAITCIDYAVEKKALVSNNSWGGGGFSQALYDTIARARDKGHLFVAAAGNDSSDNDTVPNYPSNYDLDNIIAVAATDNNDELAWFSNWGVTTVDIAAPGQDILSTIPVAMGGYGLMSGTSMATPHVTGAAALILAVNGSLSYSAVASAILNNGDSIPAADGKTVTGCRLNIGNIIPALQGNAGLRVRALSGWFRFDDGGTTVEDFTLNADWRKNWKNAGRLLGSASVNFAAAYLSYGDTDGDLLPDWWEESVGLDPLKISTDDLTPDTDRDDDRDGLTNFFEYRASIARMLRGERGLNPALRDTNSDGVTDANEDSDIDGISNISEQNLTLTDPGNPDTDDDGITDGAELVARTRPTDSISPKKDIAMTFTGGSVSNRIVFSDMVNGEYTLRHSAEQWTVETWVNPVSVAGRHVLISREVTELGLNNYELGISNGFPFVSFDLPNGGRVICQAGCQVPANTWTHLAGRFALGGTMDMNHLGIFINGLSAGETRTGMRCATGAGDLVFGSNGFAGQMQNTRVWRIAQTDLEISEMMRSELLGGNVGNRAGYLQIEQAGFIKESAITLKPNGDTVDMIDEDWTLECWVRIEAPGATGRCIARRNLGSRTEDDFNYVLGITAEGTVQGRFNMEWGVWTDAGPMFVWLSGENAVINNITGEIPIDDGEWHHVAYVRDSQFCYIYIDGLLDTKQSRIRMLPIPNIIDDPANYMRVKTAGGPLIIGEGMNDGWFVSMDEVRVWNRALSVEELKNVSKKNLSGQEEGLISYFNFDFQLGETADERASIRNPDKEYGIYIPNARCITGKQDGPSIGFDPLLSIQGVALVGMFNGVDGGLTVEDRIYRQGYKPFNQERYAGHMETGVRFQPRTAGFWILEGLDSDNDGLPDDWESANGLDAYSPDSDYDGIFDALDDEDGDGLSNLMEYQAGTNPWDADSDDDGLLDGAEDSDNDGITNADEAALGMNPGLADTDDDGMLDIDEGFDMQSRGTWAQNSLYPMINRYLSLSGTAYLQVPTGRHYAEPTPMMRWTSEGSSFTITLDVNPMRYPAAGLTNWLAKCEIGQGVYNYALALLPNGTVRAIVTADPTTLTNLTLTSSVSLPINGWSTVTLVVDREMMRATLLINGEVTGFSTLNVLNSLVTAQNSCSLVNVRFGEGVQGKMDNIGFYREALTTAGLNTIRDTENNRQGLLGYENENLYGCYTFNDGTSAVNINGEVVQNNVSRKAVWGSGQVQDFACVFWPEEKQRLASFTVQDWKMGWRNAGTIVGTGAKILPYPGEDINTKDSNGDGLPDAWSKNNGIDPYGPNASLADMDNDGLSNYAEYLISTRYALANVNPRSAKSLNQLPDYFNKPAGSKLTYGFMFSDHDFIEDWWEELYMPDAASPFIYDPLLDVDADGWSNWAEARYSQAVMNTRPDRKESVIIGGRTITEAPIPLIEAYVSYKGVQPVGNVVIQSYASPEMNGLPDAKWILAVGGEQQDETLPLGFYEAKTIQTYLTPGSVVPGTFQIQFTDTITGLVAINGFDRDGIIYATKVEYEATNTVSIGNINYITGEVVADMGFYQGMKLGVGDAVVDAGTTGTTTYVEADKSYIDVFYSSKLPGGWPQKLYLGRPDVGMVKGGTNYFFAFIDAGGAADDWDAGEPAGVSTPFATEIGWDKNTLSLQLTDYTPYNLRLSLSSGQRSEDVVLGGGAAGGGAGGGTAAGTSGYKHVRILRSSVQTSGFAQGVIFDKVIYGRDYIHEGDIMTLSRYGGYGLDWGLIDVDFPSNVWKVAYKVYVGDSDVLTNNTLVATFTNQFDTVRAVATPVAPAHGAYVYSVRPTFAWTVASSNNGYNAFAFELRSGSTAGPLVYPVTTRQVPTRDSSTGHFVWEAPFYMGDKNTVNNGVYYWRVQMLNSKFTTVTSTEWSSWRIFRWDVNTPLPPVGTATNLNGSSAGYGQLRAVVKYFGAVTNTVANRVILQAFKNRSFTGYPAAQYAYSASQNMLLTNLNLSVTNSIILRGLKPGTYYVRAFLDSNTNNVLDRWESWGYANYFGEQKALYDVRPVEVSYSSISPLATVYMEDADTDQDWFPDAYEYELNRSATNFLELTGPSDAWSYRGDGEINPTLLGSFVEIMMFMSSGSSEQLDQIVKLVSTDGQVTTPAVSASVNIENLSFGSQGPVLSFEVKPARPAQFTSALFALVMGTSSAPVSQSQTYRYNVRFSETLSAPRSTWTTVESGTVSVDADGQTVRTPDSWNPQSGPNGFFYVEIIEPVAE
jgi:subtilisin family serine protease